MSVTIFPTNNIKFCEENNLIKIHVEDCLCKDDINPNCHYCKGTGEWTEQIYPFELNLANGNFSTLWYTFGLKPDYCGQIDADILSIAVQRFEGELLYNNVFTFDQSRRYIKKLHEICQEAIRRGESVTWG